VYIVKNATHQFSFHPHKPVFTFAHRIDFALSLSSMYIHFIMWVTLPQIYYYFHRALIYTTNALHFPPHHHRISKWNRKHQTSRYIHPKTMGDQMG
jgi:hypothetical protein